MAAGESKKFLSGTGNMEYEDLSDLTEKNTRSKNNNAWEKVFDGCLVLDQIEEFGECHIVSDDLKKHGLREPRLMARMESKHDVPSVFREHDLCILPCETRGNYVIGHFEAFVDLDYSPDKLEKHPTNVEFTYDTLNPFNVSKEPSAILSAFNYGILDKIAGKPAVGLKMTNFGRESTAEFYYSINNTQGGAPYNIHVNRSQLEMDGVFESEDRIINIEAKMGIKDDFIARQLFYPYRLIRDQTDKEILNVFLTYSSGSIFTHVFTIDDANNYNSFRLVERSRYDFFEEISLNEVSNVVNGATIADEPQNIPFPQADSMQKVIDAISMIDHYPGITDKDLAYRMSIVDRQGGYYSNACNYLGIVKRELCGTTYQNYPTTVGRELFNLPPKARMLRIIELMAKHKVFNHFISEYLEQNRPPEKRDVIDWLISNIDKMDEKKDTPRRRASTVISWINWVFNISNANS